MPETEINGFSLFIQDIDERKVGKEMFILRQKVMHSFAC
jgi:hypothetical protein